MFGLIPTTDTLITGPTVVPLDLAEVKKQRRFTATTLDTLFDLWIASAVQYWEGTTGQQLITATWELWLDAFPWQREIEIPHPPLQTIVSVKYDDANGDEQTLDADTYRVLAPSDGRGILALKPGQCWPIAACQTMAVRIRYKAGLGDTPAEVPDLTKYALMMLVGHFHKFAEEVSEARANILLLPIGASDVMQDQKYLCLPRLPPPAYGPFDLWRGGDGYGVSGYGYGGWGYGGGFPWR